MEMCYKLSFFIVLNLCYIVIIKNSSDKFILRRAVQIQLSELRPIRYKLKFFLSGDNSINMKCTVKKDYTLNCKTGLFTPFKILLNKDNKRKLQIDTRALNV